MSDNDPAGVAPCSAPDGVGVAAGAEAFLGGREGSWRLVLLAPPTSTFLYEQRPLLLGTRSLTGWRPEALGLTPVVSSDMMR